MANGSAADKARKARNKFYDAKDYWGHSENLANDIAKTATGKKLTLREEEAAGKIIRNRRMIDTGRTANRAEYIARRTAKQAAAKRMEAAVSGGTKAAPKKAAPKKVAPKKTIAKKMGK